MDDMHDQHETPTSDAARGVGHYLTGTLAATDLSVRLLTWFRRRTDVLQPGDLEQAGTVLDPKREAYDAMLRRGSGRNADSRTAVLAWVGAQPHRCGDSQAELVASRAEARLRDLHPDAMTRYDQLRAGLSPVEAMREVVPLMVVEQQQMTAREAFSPLLDAATAARARSGQALDAWSAALPFVDTLPDAAKAAAAAEARLRQLHPKAMSRYDSLLESHTTAAALEEVAALIDPTGDAARRRSAGDNAAVDAAAARPPQAPDHRYAAVVREALGDDLAAKVLQDESWATLASALDKAERLGANPVELLTAAAGERELDSAKHVAGVLTFRIEQHDDPQQAPAGQDIPMRTRTAADRVTASFPTPVSALGDLARPQEHDLALLGAALELDREGLVARTTATGDDATSRSGQRKPGPDKVLGSAVAGSDDGGEAVELAVQGDARGQAVRSGAPAATTAASGYPMSVQEVTARRAATRGSRPRSSSRVPASRAAPTPGRRL